MIFQNPFFLWGLLAIAIPVAIHLFNFRRHKTIYFSTLRFLRAVQQETKSQSKLRHLLILLARCVAIIGLVLAFAGPFIPGKIDPKTAAQQQRVALYVDNSFSTNAESAEGQVLESERKRARNIIEAFGRGASFVVFSNDFSAIDEQDLSYDKALERVGSLHVSSNSHTVAEALVRGRDLLKKTDAAQATNKTLYLISDFQQNTTNAQLFTNDSAVRTVLIPVAGQHSNNLYIDSCWFENPIHAPQQPEQLLVKIKNGGDDDYTNIPLKLYLHDSLKAVASASIKAKGDAVITLTYNNAGTGVQWGRVEISDFPVTFDNDYYFSYRIASQMPVLCIANERSPLKPQLEALFRNDMYCKATIVAPEQLVYSDLPHYQLVIVAGINNLSIGIAEQLRLYAQSGGSICFVPNMRGNLTEYNQFLSAMIGLQFTAIDSSRQRLKTIDFKHPLFNAVFKQNNSSVLLPEVGAHFTLAGKERSGATTVLECENGDDFLIASRIRQGAFYVFTSGLADKNEGFTSHPLFVASLYNMALLHQQTEALQYVIGRNTVIVVPNCTQESDRVLHLRAQKGAFDAIPRALNDAQLNTCRLFTENMIREAGTYSITATNSDSLLASPAFNYNRNESLLQFFSPSQLSDMLLSKGLQSISIFDKNADLLSDSIRKTNHGTPLWKWFVVLALLAMVAEVLLLRFKK